MKGSTVPTCPSSVPAELVAAELRWLRRSLSAAAAKILDADDTWLAGKFQSQTSKVARYCVSKQIDEQDAGEVDRNPASGGSDT